MDTQRIANYYSIVVEPILQQTLKSYQDLSVLSADLPAGMIDDAVFPRTRRPERPTLLYLGWLLAGGTANSDVPAKAAVALEFAHSGGLIHDDVVDAAARRNWLPSVWAGYAARHSDVRLGRHVAIWLGDLLFYWAHDILGAALVTLPADAQVAARTIWTHGFTGLIGSQHLDLIGFAQRNEGEAALPAAQNVARLKGVFVATLPLQLGAAMAGGSPNLLAALRAYGLPLGEAYVYRNDVEGVFGDPASTDYVPNDLRQQRLSVLLAIAQSRGTAQQAEVLGRAGTPDLTDEDAADIMTIIEDTGARQQVEKLSEVLAMEAKAACDHALISCWARPFLTAIADRAMTFHNISG